MKFLQSHIFIFFIIWLSSCDVTTDAEYYNNMADPPLKLVRWPYLQNNIADSVTIAWKTTKAANSCHVIYATEDNKRIKKIGNVIVQRVNSMNTVTITNLPVNKKVYYEVYTNDILMAEGENNYFFSAEGIGNNFSFVAIADVGQPPSWRGHFNETTRQIAQLKVQPNLGLGLGDMVYPNGQSEGADDYFFKLFHETLSHVPLYPVMGNHDHKSKPNENFMQEWILPGNEHYYSFDYGNTHFIGLDSGDDTGYFEGDDQMIWLENDLKNAQGKYDWIIVFQHHHGRTCSYKNQENSVINTYKNLVKYNVDLVFNGHIHTYERLKPLDSLGNVLERFQNSNDVYPNIPDGFITITAGTGGKLSRWEPYEDENYCQEGIVAKALHELSFVEVSINDKKLSYKLISSASGETLDRFIIDKTLQNF
jgi:LEA14-like dessication related protein